VHVDSEPVVSRNVARSNPERDRGTVLVLVLAFMVIGALVVIPMLTYASTVLRVNTVLVEQTVAVEDVRAGARIAVASPVKLFEGCATSAWRPVATPGVSTTSQCRQVSEVGVIEELQIPVGAVAVHLGQAVPAGFSGSTVAPPANATEGWWGSPNDLSCVTWCPTPKTSTVWLPDLPERASSVQEATGYLMPAPRQCRVYFPGTYSAPLVISDATYFASGVYYFTKNVTIVGGADAVAGYGLAEGCAGDVESVLDMPPNPLPSNLNVDGLGATFIFGDSARLVIDNTQTTGSGGALVPNTANLPVRFEINQRYVENVADAEARVSILSVNGDQDTIPSTTVGPLNVPGVISMHESMVKTSTGARVTASSKNLMPSVHSAEPRAPLAPKSVTVAPLFEPAASPNRGAVRVSWAPPAGIDEGGMTITEYRVTALPSGRWCRTDGATTCVVRGLPLETQQSFTVTARNAVDISPASAPPANATPRSTSPVLTPSTPVSGVSVADPATYLNEAEVSWTAPANPPAPIVRYEVVATRMFLDLTATEVVDTMWPSVGCSTSSFRATPAATSCVVTGLPPVDTTAGLAPGGGTYTGYRFSVRAVYAATNFGVPFNAVPAADIVGTSGNATSTISIPAFTGTVAAVPPALPVWPVASPYVPDPIVDINLAGAANAKVTVAGYVATPQGRVRINNPAGRPVALTGGVVAGSYDVDTASMSQPNTQVGFQNTVLQRTIEIRTTGSDDVVSTMRVQINANGAEAVVNSWVIQ
jgi:hypothetical protein